MESVRHASSGFFEAGQHTDIVATPTGERYTSRVEQVEEEVLGLLMPMRGTEYLELPPGSPLTLIASKRLTTYAFSTQVLRYQRYPEPLMFVRRPPDNAGVQRRKFNRVHVDLEKVQLWASWADRPHETVECQILDLSAGGAMLQTRERLSRDTQVSLRFELPEPPPAPPARARSLAARRSSPYASSGNQQRFQRRKAAAQEQARRERNDGRRPGGSESLQLIGHVVTTVCFGSKRRGCRRYRSGIEFNDLGDKDRDRIIKFVFRRELELRRRGVL